MPKRTEPRQTKVPKWAVKAGMSADEYRRWLSAGRDKTKSVRAANATDLSLDMDKLYDPDEYAPFEGPRLSFSWLVGESPTWSGPNRQRVYDDHGAAVCRYCQHLQVVPAHAYCLGCDRCGKDSVIGKPAPVPRARKTYKPTPGLKGGVG